MRKTILLAFLLFFTAIAFAATKVGNSQPEITVEYNETVTIVDYSLSRNLFGIIYYYNMTYSTSDNRTFIFQPVNELSDGLYFFSVTAKDLVENQITHEYSFEIEATNLTIYLINPSYGVSETAVFDLSVYSNRKSFLCKYTTDGFNYPFADMLISEQYFTTTDNSLHTIENFNKLEGSQEGTIYIIYVKCNTTNGTINEEDPAVFYLSVDSSAPIITNLYASPSEVIYPPAETTLHVITDDNAICNYSYIDPATLRTVNGNFDNYDDKIFSIHNQVTLSDLNQGLHTFSVICMNGAEIKSETRELQVNVDFNASDRITLIGPSGTLNNRTFNQRIETNKPSLCGIVTSYSQGEPVIDYFSSVYSLEHTRLKVNQREGNYTYGVACVFEYSGNTVEGIMQYTLDRTVPGKPSIDPQAYVCSNDKLSATLYVTDPSGIEYYLVRIYNESTFKNVVVAWTRTGAEAELTDLNLDYDHKYYWSAKAIDKAGNEGSEQKSTLDYTWVYDPSNKNCQEDDPPTIWLSKKETAEGVNVTIRCYDASGCDLLYYYIIEEDDYFSKCTTANFLDYIEPVMVTENITFCYKQ